MGDQIINAGMDAAKDAFYILLGAFLGKVLLGFVGKFVPQVQAFKSYAAILLGLVGYGYMQSRSNVVGNIFLGLTIAGMLEVIGGFLNPVFAQAEQAIVK